MSSKRTSASARALGARSRLRGAACGCLHGRAPARPLAELTRGGAALLDRHAGLRNPGRRAAGDAATRSAARASTTGSCAWSTTPRAGPARRRALERGRAPRPAHPGPAPRARTAASSPPPTTPWRWPAASSSPCSTTTTSSTPTPWRTSTRRSLDDPEADYVYTDEDKIDRSGRHSGPVLQAGLVAGADADPDVHLPPQRPAPRRWSRRSAASTPSSRAPRTGTWS